MEKKEQVIEIFIQLQKRGLSCNIKVIQDIERKLSEYAKVKLEFIRANNINESIQAYADFYEVYFNSLDEFVNFFNINRGNANRNLFVDFYEIFSKFKPDKKREERIKQVAARR